MHSPHSGGVQLIGERFLAFSDYSIHPSVYVFDFIEKKVVWEYAAIPGMYNPRFPKEFRSFQEAKFMDLSEFLKNNKL